MAVTKTRARGRTAARKRRHTRVRKKVVGTAARPRLIVNRSARHTFVQLVDDTTGRTLASASTLEAELRDADGDKTAKARQVGTLLAERALAGGQSPRRSSTGLAGPTTAGSPPWPTPRAKAAWPCDDQRRDGQPGEGQHCAGWAEYRD